MLLCCAYLAPGCNDDRGGATQKRWTAPGDDAVLHPVTIVNPPGTGLLRVAASKVNGDPVGIACSTCHEAGAAAAIVGRAGENLEPHANIELSHGNLECASCHVVEHPDRLSLASGKAVDILDSIALCSQCHGPIREAYDHGAHGGMRGHWDLQRGTRERNTCIACHSAHRPAYPHIQPAPPPADRHRGEHDHGSDSLIRDRYEQAKDSHE
jgi:hypothetical protein